MNSKVWPRLAASIWFLLSLAAAGQSEPVVFEGVKLVEPSQLPATAGTDGAMGGAARGGMGGGRGGTSESVPVQFFMPTERTSDVSIVLIPGGGLPSWSYTATPDGRKGWAQQLAAAGIPVYLFNPPASFRDEPGRWNKEAIWSLWGIGPEFGTPYEDSKFPVTAIDNLQASFFIQRAGGGAGHLLTLLDEIGPAVVLGHSAGGGATFAAARAEHANLRGTIAVETTNCPTEPELLKKIYVDGNRAFLSIWGDNLDRGAPSMQVRYESCQAASDAIAAAGGNALTVRLPEDLGIGGNTHLMMQDLNNLDIGNLIIDWIYDNLNEEEYSARRRNQEN